MVGEYPKFFIFNRNQVFNGILMYKFFCLLSSRTYISFKSAIKWYDSPPLSTGKERKHKALRFFRFAAKNPRSAAGICAAVAACVLSSPAVRLQTI